MKHYTGDLVFSFRHGKFQGMHAAAGAAPIAASAHAAPAVIPASHHHHQLHHANKHHSHHHHKSSKGFDFGDVLGRKHQPSNVKALLQSAKYYPGDIGKTAASQDSAHTQGHVGVHAQAHAGGHGSKKIAAPGGGGKAGSWLTAASTAAGAPAAAASAAPGGKHAAKAAKAAAAVPKPTAAEQLAATLKGLDSVTATAAHKHKGAAGATAGAAAAAPSGSGHHKAKWKLGSAEFKKAEHKASKGDPKKVGKGWWTLEDHETKVGAFPGLKPKDRVALPPPPDAPLPKGSAAVQVAATGGGHGGSAGL
eukprot:TRINITY_DN46978_c0_g1_i1.p1 TRINITY_DN46978_c0_g1~~TRINITY_DN46978_c0_g1_i1.p1  ORF type:complete len:307 (+),score=72.17 TRINITY_DN46978_c0_g1_i1:101-1021(+)